MRDERQESDRAKLYAGEQNRTGKDWKGEEGDKNLEQQHSGGWRATVTYSAVEKRK